MLSLVQCVNGNYSVVAEGLAPGKQAKVNFYQKCATLWNADDVLTGEVAVLNEQLEVWDGCKEQIVHAVEPTKAQPTEAQPTE